MALKNEYLQKVYENVEKRNPGEKEFLQAVYDILFLFLLSGGRALFIIAHAKECLFRQYMIMCPQSYK